MILLPGFKMQHVWIITTWILLFTISTWCYSIDDCCDNSCTSSNCCESNSNCCQQNSCKVVSNCCTRCQTSCRTSSCVTNCKKDCCEETKRSRIIDNDKDTGSSDSNINSSTNSNVNNTNLNHINFTASIGINNTIEILNNVNIPIVVTSSNENNIQIVQLGFSNSSQVSGDGSNCPDVCPPTTPCPTPTCPDAPCACPDTPRSEIIRVPVPIPIPGKPVYYPVIRYVPYPIVHPIPYPVPQPSPGCCTILNPCVSYSCQYYQTICTYQCSQDYMYRPFDPCQGQCNRRSFIYNRNCYYGENCQYNYMDCNQCTIDFYQSYEGYLRCGGCFYR